MAVVPTINKRGILILISIGAVVATFCDAIHARTGTLIYPHPVWFQQAWWVMPFFAVAFLAMALSYIPLANVSSRLLDVQQSRAPGSAGAFVEALAAFAFVYLISGFGNEESKLLCWIFYVSFLVRWGFSYERGWLISLAVSMAVVGMLVEGLMGAAGWVSYTQQDVYHVPYWLGAVYMHGAFALREGMRCFVYVSRTGS